MTFFRVKHFDYRDFSTSFCFIYRVTKTIIISFPIKNKRLAHISPSAHCYLFDVMPMSANNNLFIFLKRIPKHLELNLNQIKNHKKISKNHVPGYFFMKSVITFFEKCGILLVSRLKLILNLHQ